MKAAVILDSGELQALQYPVVVEMWDTAKAGRRRRAFLAEFPGEGDRRRARKYYNLFHKWYLVTGAPQEHVFTPEGLRFAKRLCDFFGAL